MKPVLDWLLEDDAPGVQYQTRLRLLGESSRSRRMTALARRCNDYPSVARMLDRVDEAIAAGNYQKYRGAYWTLTFLADLHADGRDRRARRLADHVLDSQLETGGFTASSASPGTKSAAEFEIVCLTANLLRSLVHLGYGGDERVRLGYQRLADRILPHGGVPCIVLQYCLHRTCKMTIPQTLRCVAAAPDGVAPAPMQAVRDILVKELLSVRVFRYVRPDTKAYRQAVRARPKGTREKDVRSKWMRKRPSFPPDALLPKVGWLRFGFPRSYNPDLLEAMLALAELGVDAQPALDEALGHIEKKRGRDGRWRLDDSLNGKMLATIERKGRPSKWVTLRAMTVLQHFGRISDADS